MVDAVRQIRHDLESLEKAALALGEEFDQVYDNYLAALRTSIQNQVVLACYHLCTQTYPQRFLDLSFRQRETLQQSIQTCIRQCQKKLEHAYVLATGKWVEEEEDITTLRGSRRSLPSSEHLRRKRRGRSERRPSDDLSDQDGPSVEFIAITNIDGDEAIEASKDPFLAAALSEFAESLALDEDAIIKRVKQELLRKASGSKSSKSSEGKRGIDAVLAALEGELENDDDSDSDDSDGDVPSDDASNATIDEANHSDSNHADLGEDDASAVDSTPQDTILSAAEDQQSGEQKDEETMAIADHVSPESAASDTVATALSPVKGPDDAPEFPGNPEGKTFSDYDETLTPDVLASRQEQLEENLAGFLRDLSKQVNHELHQVGMIPKKIPSAVLRAALQTDMSSDVSGPPNVLNLLVEAEGKSKDSKVMRVTALRLRPAELEFSDPHLSACRSRIRELTGKLQKLGKQYHKKQQEQSIAEAESAWRSSWYEPQD